MIVVLTDNILLYKTITNFIFKFKIKFYKYLAFSVIMLNFKLNYIITEDA